MRGRADAVKTFACVRSSVMPLVDVMALFRLKSTLIPRFSLSVRTRPDPPNTFVRSIAIFPGAPPERLQILSAAQGPRAFADPLKKTLLGELVTKIFRDV